MKAVLFDFAGTLFSDRALRGVHLEQLRFVAGAVGVEAADRQLRAAYREGLGLAYRAVTRSQFYSHRELFAEAFTATAAALGRELDPVVARAAVDRQYRATIEAATLRADVVDTLRELRVMGVHVQIVSNMDQEQLAGLIDRLGLGELLDAATSSEAAGSCKPDPGIYRVALTKAFCQPAEALFVGDSPRHDVHGPSALGMRTAWLTVDAGPEPPLVQADFVITALAEVPGIVRREILHRERAR
ncbi:HAD family hydrolase [Streptacidiphilus sp. PAMC 29251]